MRKESLMFTTFGVIKTRISMLERKNVETMKQAAMKQEEDRKKIIQKKAVK